MNDEKDTREKLEADVREWCVLNLVCSVTCEERVIGWLDRQAAITEREVGGTLLRQDERIAELLRQVDMLSERKCPGYEPENHYCRYHAQDFELNDRTVSRLKRENVSLASDLGECMAERDELKERIAELERENAKLSAAELHYRSECEQLRGKLEAAEKPDSLELVCASLRALDPNVVMTKAACDALADRIEKLAKEGGDD